MTDAVHVPTGKRCRVLQRNAALSFCDFGGPANQFAWIPNSELEPDGEAERDPRHAMVRALLVVAFTPHIREYLERTDPEALERILGALGGRTE